MRKHQTDKRIFIATFILVLIGTIMVSIIGPSYTNIQNIAYGRNDDPNQAFKSQILYVFLAFFAMVFFLKIPLKQVSGEGVKHKKLLNMTSKMPEILMFGSLILCLIMYISSLTVKLPFVRCALGACRWLNLGFFQLQAAELVKFGALFYLGKIRYNYQNRTKTTSVKKQKGKIGEFTAGIKGILAKTDGRVFWLKFILTLGAAVFFLVVAQKDLGSALPLIAMALAMLLVSGARLKYFLIIGVAGLALAVLALSSPHRQERLRGFLQGDCSNAYHINNALIAIGSGGLFGVGIGNNVQTAGYLPESITDSMFAVIGETIGFVGISVVLLFYYMLLSRILKVADCIKDSYYQMVTVGIFAWLAGHVVVNIAAMTGLVPLTGITLPLLSKGGTSLILNMAIIGLVLNISQYTMRADLTDAERK